MKKLIIINGTSLAGKSTVSEVLLKMLDRAVFLDGDWCWYMHPFQVTPENIAMVEDNIRHLLQSYLSNSSIEYIVFCWVLHKEFIFNHLLDPLVGNYQLHRFTLLADPSTIRRRAKIRGGCSETWIDETIAKQENYLSMAGTQIDTSDCNAEEIASRIYRRLAIKS
ncbi:MAG: AAA family ATPase [Pseudobacteriovorax sp.]|nr:AAA family ATPase [Pseudobacteriovorax sp.]